MPSIVPIVEGDGEVTARPELLLKRENFRLFSPRVWPKRKQDKIWSAKLALPVGIALLLA